MGLTNVLARQSIKAVSKTAMRSSSNFSSKKLASNQVKFSQTIPKNIEETQASQKVKFSPIRNRDTSAAQISSKVSKELGSVSPTKSLEKQGNQRLKSAHNGKFTDAHLNVYDSNNAVSLSSVVSGNVPSPFKSDGKKASDRYNMQGGQPSQGDKYISGDLHNHHHRKNTVKGSKGRAHDDVWAHDYICTLRPWWNVSLDNATNHLVLLTNYHEFRADAMNHFMRRAFHTSRSRLEDNKSTQSQEVKLSQKQKLKRAAKDYGSTVIVFHVTISLASLGICYLIISSGIDVSGIIKSLGINLSSLQTASDSSTAADSSGSSVDISDNRTEAVVAGLSTFMIAYTIHKVMAPGRIAITLFSTPIIVRHLRKIGFLKAPKV